MAEGRVGERVVEGLWERETRWVGRCGGCRWVWGWRGFEGRGEGLKVAELLIGGHEERSIEG